MLTRRQLMVTGLGLALLGRVRAADELRLRGPVFTILSPEYDSLCRWFNPELRFHPEVFAFPMDEADVVTAVEWARQQCRVVGWVGTGDRRFPIEAPLLI